jgi:hypothetical protein
MIGKFQLNEYQNIIEGKTISNFSADVAEWSS